MFVCPRARKSLFCCWSRHWRDATAASALVVVVSIYQKHKQQQQQQPKKSMGGVERTERQGNAFCHLT